VNEQVERSVKVLIMLVTFVDERLISYTNHIYFPIRYMSINLHEIVRYRIEKMTKQCSTKQKLQSNQKKTTIIYAYFHQLKKVSIVDRHFSFAIQCR